MWRFFKTAPRVIRQQWNSSVRPSPQSVHCEDDPEKERQKTSLLPGSYAQFYQQRQRWQLEWQADGDKDTTSGRHGAQRRQSWSLPNCNSGFIEAVGWGTALLLGLQLSRLYHLQTSHDQRQANPESTDDYCPVKWLKQRSVQLTTHRHTGISYINSPKSSGPQTKETRSAHIHSLHSELLTEPTTESNNELLDYESLLDIEVRSQQFDCTIPTSVDEPTSPDIEVDGQSQETLSEDTGQKYDHAETARHAAESQLEEAMDEWCTLSNRCTSRVYHHFALQHMRAGRMDQAFEQWLEACQQGDPRAHFNVALCYELGKGTREDPAKAVEHYAIAAAGGHHIAMYNLAVYYLTGRGGLEKNIAMATSLLEKAAMEGLSRAQTDLGVILGEQNGDWQQAVGLFVSAADQDDMSAKYYLGVCYENGWGVMRDPERAAELYKQAAVAGHGMALHSLGIFNEKGKAGLPVDRTEARNLYQKAVRAGYHAAEADHKRLSHQLNQEKFEKELQEIQMAHRKKYGLSTQKQSGRKSQSSPALSHASLSFYIRSNLMDFGLDETPLTETSPVHTPSGNKVKFHIGDIDSPPPEPGGQVTPNPPSVIGGGGFGAMSGGFGDFKIPKKIPTTKREKKSKDGFDMAAFKNDMAAFKELEQQAEMRLVLCS